MPTETIEYLVCVHTLPHDLVLPLPPERKHLEETSRIWHYVINTHLLWRVSHFDEWGHLWIDIQIENDDREAEYHMLRLDEGCYRKHETDPYEIEVDEGEEEYE